jgi:hypothetical protein
MKGVKVGTLETFIAARARTGKGGREYEEGGSRRVNA